MKTLTLILIFITQSAWPHARLLPGGTLPPRNTLANKEDAKPCGPTDAGAVRTAVLAGSTITVQWEEFINHPGYFEILFSPAGDVGFTLLKTVQDNQNGNVGGMNHQFSTQITVPNAPCTACTIQLIQVMTENPASPTLYYSCANISIVTVMPTPTPTVTPTPTPTVVPTPIPTPSPSPTLGHGDCQ